MKNEVNSSFTYSYQSFYDLIKFETPEDVSPSKQLLKCYEGTKNLTKYSVKYKSLKSFS